MSAGGTDPSKPEAGILARTTSQEKANPARENARELEADLHAYLIGCLDITDALAKLSPSRALSLVKTKLDEAEMWLLRALEEGDN